MFSSSILSNYLGSLLGLAVSKGLRFLGVVYCIRVVGDYTWGQSVSTLALFSFLTFLIDQGLSSSPLLFHLGNRAADKRLLFLISTYRLSMAGLLIAALHLYHYFVQNIDSLILVYSFVLLPRALGIDWWFQRRQLYQLTLFVASVRTLLFFALTVLFVKRGVGPETLLVIELASEALSVAFSYLLLRMGKNNGARTEAPGFGLFDLIRFSLPFLIIAILNNVQVSMDILMLRHFLGSETVAHYDVGIKVGFLYFFVGATIIQIIRPKLTLLHQKGDLERMGLILRTTSAMLLLAGSVLLIPSLYFSEPLVGFLFNKGHGLTEFVFRWGALWVSLCFMTMLATDTLLSVGKRRLYIWAALASAATNIGTNLLLIGAWGGHGAIFAKMAAEIVFLAIALWCLPGDIRRKFSGSLATQSVALAGFLGIYALSDIWGRPMTGAVLSVLLCAGILWFSKDLGRKGLAVLREN